MRLLYSVSVLAAVSLGASTFACSDAESTPPAEDAGPGFSTSTGDSGPPPASSTEIPNRPPDGGSSGSSGSSGGGGGDGGGGGGGAGALCQTDSIRETEPNNDLATANKVEAKSLTYCGRVATGNADYVKFQMPNKQWSFDDPTTSGGAVSVALFIDGEEQDLGNIPLKPGSDYVLRITTDDAGDVSYRLHMRFN